MSVCVKQWLRPLLCCAVLLSGAAQASNWVDVGSAKYRFLFKTITTASLQVPAAQREQDWLSPAYPKRLRIDYGLAVSAERLATLFMDSIESSYGEALLGQRQAVEAFVGAFQSVEKGDHYQLQWLEGELRLSLNQQLLYQLRDPSVAQMLLSVWMGEEQPISRTQRRLLHAQWQAYQQQIANEG